MFHGSKINGLHMSRNWLTPPKIHSFIQALYVKWFFYNRPSYDIGSATRSDIYFIPWKMNKLREICIWRFKIFFDPVFIVYGSFWLTFVKKYPVIENLSFNDRWFIRYVKIVLNESKWLVFFSLNLCRPAPRLVPVCTCWLLHFSCHRALRKMFVLIV